jgi:hypothetical protein
MSGELKIVHWSKILEDEPSKVSYSPQPEVVQLTEIA